MAKTLAPHPAAELFPLMDGERLGQLRDDIEAHGLRQPIVLCEGKILDGRNRYRVCMELGIEPVFVTFEGDPYAYAWSANGARRDLVAAQRYLIWAEVAEKSEAWQAEQAAIAEKANMARSKSQKGVPKGQKERAPTTSGRTSAKAKAKASKTNRGEVERMDRLRKERPDLATGVRLGEIKPTEAMRQMKKAEVAQAVRALPEGTYRVIYADPPWKYSDARAGLGSGDGQTTDRASSAAENHYPTMTNADIEALDVRSLRAPDCVLFLWATFPLLPDALDVLSAWGFKYKTAFVWDKQRGTFGHYHKAEAELLIVATHGSCTPETDERENQIQRWPRAGHSRKPAEAIAMIDRLYPSGPRLEMFCRGAGATGWNSWGAEAADAT